MTAPRPPVPVTSSRPAAPPQALPGRVYRRWVFLAILLAFVIASFVYAWKQRQQQPLQAGGTAPDLKLRDLSNREWRLADFRGKVVFLNFWATYCPPCREEMPSMEALHRQLQGKPFEMLAVSIDSSEDPVRAFVAEFRLTFPVGLDPAQELAQRYGITGVPETFIIDKSGSVAAKFVGAQNWTAPEHVQRLHELVNRPARQ